MKKRIGAVLYNGDRTIASAIWGTTQETISSEVGRIALGAGKPDGWTPRWEFEICWAKALARWLNTFHALWGFDHTAKAIKHSDALDAVDDGKEQ